MSESEFAHPPGDAAFEVTSPGAFWDRASKILKGRCCSGAVIVTDETVLRLHGASFPRGVPVLLLSRGESGKSLASVEELLRGFFRLGLDRKCCVVAVGGGVVCDVAAFAAAIWLRGVDVILCPTTLLSQADAGLGGKNGVNFCGVKNLIGTIRPSLGCICDPLFLTTLDARDVTSGLAEIAKMGILFDWELCGFLESTSRCLNEKDTRALSRAVRRALELKADVVRQDFFETGCRRALNFGHTFGHALEAASSDLLRHGEAVAAGMELALRFGLERGLVHERVVSQALSLLRTLQLPQLSDVRRTIDLEAACRALLQDKKREKRDIRFVLPGEERLGSGEDIQIIPIGSDELSQWLRRVLQEGA